MQNYSCVNPLISHFSKGNTKKADDVSHSHPPLFSHFFFRNEGQYESQSRTRDRKKNIMTRDRKGLTVSKQKKKITRGKSRVYRSSSKIAIPGPIHHPPTDTTGNEFSCWAYYSSEDASKMKYKAAFLNNPAGKKTAGAFQTKRNVQAEIEFFFSRTRNNQT